MEGAYWFLFSLWCIQIIYSIASLCACKVKTDICKIVFIILVCGVFSAVLLIIGIKVGITFLGIKYTLYYIPYFLLGWLMAKLNSNGIFEKNNKLISMLVPIVSLIYIFAISKFKVFDSPDTLVGISMRVMISLMACFLVSSMFNGNVYSENKITKFLMYAGSHSLEFYVIHLLLCKFIMADGIYIYSIKGVFYSSMCFAFLIIVTIVIIYIINIYKYTKFLFFAKK